VDTLAARDGQDSLRRREPRRSALRRAVKHGDAEDLGPVRLEKQDSFIYLTPKKQAPKERDFSLLIKEAGLYTLKGRVLGLRKPDLSIHVFSNGDEENVSPQAAFRAAFHALLPLVFRSHKMKDCILKGGRKRRLSDILDRDVYSGYTRFITVCDAEGPAVFIGLPVEARRPGGDLLVISRENLSVETSDFPRRFADCGYSFVEVKAIFGGKHV